MDKSKFESLDKKIIQYLSRYSHKLHRISLGFFFIWMGVLKVIGYQTNTKIIAESIYWGNPETMVYLLGGWELLIGIFFTIRPLVRIALLFLIIRIPGILMAFILKTEVCFIYFPLAPTIEGQFLIKDLTIFFAALAIAASLDEKSSLDKHH